MNSSKQIKVGALISYLSVFISVLSGLFYTPWMIEKVGKDDYGLYMLVSSLIAILTLDFGLGAAVTMFLSKFRAERETEQVNKFLPVAYKIYFLIDIILVSIGAILLLFVDSFYSNLPAEQIAKLKDLFIIL